MMKFIVYIVLIKFIVSYFEYTGNNEQLFISLLKLKLRLMTDNYSLIYGNQQKDSEYSNVDSIQMEELTRLRRMCKATLKNINFAIKKVKELKSRYK